MTIGYSASISTAWVDVSDGHRTIRERAEQFLIGYLNGQDVPHIAVAGPYGQGKTQLMFHLMRTVASKNALPLFTSASALLKLAPTGTDPSDFATQVQSAIGAEARAFRQGKSGPLTVDTTLLKTVPQYFTGNVSSSAPVILFIDEWEQVYEELQERVRTIDRNPLRPLLDMPGVYLVLAFAPRSGYEIGRPGFLGQAEADLRRLTVFRIPPVRPKEFRDYLKLEAGRANFCWWLGRGRMGLMLKAFQDSDNFDIQSPGGLRSFVETSLGVISGVPALELDMLFRQDNWRDISDLKPRACPPESMPVFTLDTDFEAKAKRFFMKLGFGAAHAVSLGYYLQMLLEALSGEGEDVPLHSTSDLSVLVEATRALALEFEEEPEALRVFQERPEGLAAESDLLAHALLDRSAPLGEHREHSERPPFAFKEIAQFFPFPLSVPTLPGVSAPQVRQWILERGSLPIAEDRNEDTYVLVLEDFAHFTKYVREHEQIFAQLSLPERHHTQILLLSGDVGELKGLSLWLATQQRLFIETLQPKMLADLVRNACFLIESRDSSQVTNLREHLTELSQRFGEEGDRGSARKVSLYCATLDHGIQIGTRAHDATFTYSDDRRATLLDAHQRMREASAFPVPFWLAFREDDPVGSERLADARELLVAPRGHLSNFMPQAGGYRTAVDFLPSRRGRQPAQLNDQIRRVRSFYKPRLNELRGLADVVSEETFVSLVDDDLSRFLLRTYYRLLREPDPPQQALDRVREGLQQAIAIGNAIENEDQLFNASVGLSFSASMNFSRDELTGTQKLLDLLDPKHQMRKEHKLVMYEFIRAATSTLQEKAGVYQKEVEALKYDPLWLSLGELGNLRNVVDSVHSDVLEYLGVSRDRLSSLVDVALGQAQSQASSYAAFVPENLAAVHRTFESLLEVREALLQIQESIERIKERLADLPEGG